MIFYAIELRLFVRCYTALLRACLLVAGGGIGLCPRRWTACVGLSLGDRGGNAEGYDFFYGS